MRIIFLDIDGVLNNVVSHGRRWSTRLPRIDEPDKCSAVPPFAPECVVRFNRLIEQTHANVVISSTWGRLFRFELLVWYLTDQGVRCNVIGMTPTHTSYRPRGHDIQQWLDEWDGDEIESFCILDDHEDMLELRPRLVLTKTATGLTDEDVSLAYRLLIGSE